MGRESYLIEFRFFGSAKYKLKNLAYEVNNKFDLDRLDRHKPVPHITIIAPFSTRDERRLKSDFKKICKQYPDRIEFRISGYDTFEDSNVVYVNVEEHDELKELHWSLSQTLRDYCDLRERDLDKEYHPHATLAMRMSDQKFERVKRYVECKPDFDFKHTLMRVTLLKNSKILREYDFMQDRMLRRREALDDSILDTSFDILLDDLEEERDSSELERIPDQNGEKLVEPQSFSQRLFSFLQPQIYVTGDLHLDHGNIIDYCDRPFSDASEMNEALVNNWNETVRERDVVYFLGDLAYGRHKTSEIEWLKRLNGNIIFIEGNHDESHKILYHEKLFVEYEGIKFLLVHNSREIPDEWNGWTIHGHHHNNNTDEYPLFHEDKKRINVSTELTNYTPIRLDTILNWIKA